MPGTAAILLMTISSSILASLPDNAPVSPAPQSPALPVVWASSNETPNLRPDLVSDGNSNSRWSSSFNDNQWLAMDLGEEREIRSITIVWNSAAAADYDIQLATKPADFATVATRKDTAKEGPEEITLAKPQRARYLRLNLRKRSTEWGFSIHEILINGRSPSAESLPTPPADAVYRDPKADPKARAHDAVARMSFREKTQMLSGRDMFYFPGNERLGLRRLFFADATMGLRLPASTAFPSFICLAASFDPDLASRYADAVGEECRAKGVDVLLGPGVNLYRTPQGGRNFEYLGEDPYLASHMVVPYIKAVQDHGVVATVKHFAANNHEWNRKASNSIIDERTLHELYLQAFEAAIKDAHVGAVMTSYNLVNGEYAAQNRALVQGVLRDDWGFDGLVMTDWWSVFDSLKMIRSGVSLEMPHGDYLNEPTIRELIDADLIAESEIDAMVEATLRTCFRFGLYDREQADSSAKAISPEHDQITLDTARAGMVLLRNEGSFLPLDRAKTKTIVLLGTNTRQTETSGYGAARVEPTNPVSILDAVKKAAGPSVQVLQFDELTDEARAAIAKADATFVSAATREREANDRAFELPEQTLALINEATAASDRVGVIITAGSGVEMASWIDDTRSVLLAWFAGNTGNTAVAEILFGDVNPSGRLPFTIERAWADNAAYGSFLPEDATFNDQPIWGRERAIFPVVYREGVFSGYRHFDAAGIKPLFPFGHGLSYTAFSYDRLSVEQGGENGAEYTVSCRVTNTGKRAGSDVVQLYLAQPESVPDQPVRTLEGFRRVTLEPGRSTTVRFPLSYRELRHYDTGVHAWRIEPGERTAWVGSSSADLRGSVRVTVTPAAARRAEARHP